MDDIGEVGQAGGTLLTVPSPMWILVGLNEGKRTFDALTSVDLFVVRMYAINSGQVGFTTHLEKLLLPPLV